MPKYYLKSGIFLNGEILPQDSIQEITDADAKPFVDQGSIELSDTKPEAPAPEKITGETVQEFEGDGFKYTKLNTVDGFRYVQEQDDRQDEITETSFDSAYQRKVWLEEQTKRNEEAATVAAAKEGTEQQIKADLGIAPEQVTITPVQPEV